MSQIEAARVAFSSGDLERARSLYMSAYDSAPGEASFGLARIALVDGDFERAENLSRVALDSGAAVAVTLLADAVGRQGRRAEAEKIALDAMSSFADSGLLRAVLGEQRIRQGEWELGTQNFIDALTLDGRGEVLDYLKRVIVDMTRGHAAGKVPMDKAMAFINRVQYNAPSRDQEMQALFPAARRALNSKTVLQISDRSTAVPPSPPPSAVPSSRAVSPPATSSQSPLKPGEMPHGVIMPPLVAVMQRDRTLNEALQAEVGHVGLPKWPSENEVALDTVPRMQPTTLQIDPEEFQRQHLNLTTGSIASEIIIERGLQNILREMKSQSATPPTFDEVGLVQIEMALSDGAFEDARQIPDLYYGEQEHTRVPLLGLGGFLGECIVRRGTATWTYARPARDSVVETVERNLAPFELAEEWFDAEDKDDVHLSRILGEARLLGEIQSISAVRHDLTEGLRDRALTMKIAELWMQFRMHPLETPQNLVAEAIRPLNVLDEIIFFALDPDFAPPMARGKDDGAMFKGEVAMAYVRNSGEFLCLGSRQHFARAIGAYLGKIDKDNAQRVLDAFNAFHRPNEKIIRSGENGPSIERRKGAVFLNFRTTGSGGTFSYSLVHHRGAAVEWHLLKRD